MNNNLQSFNYEDGDFIITLQPKNNDVDVWKISNNKSKFTTFDGHLTLTTNELFEKQPGIRVIKVIRTEDAEEVLLRHFAPRYVFF